MSRREALRVGARLVAATALGTRAVVRAVAGEGVRRSGSVFDVAKYGAVGDGVTPDTAAIQRAIDEAAAAGGGARVLIRGGRRHLIGALQLRGGIELHLADDAELLVSTRPEDFAPHGAAITAHAAHGLRITGTGRINGRSPEFMERYDEAGEWWRPKRFRPRLVVLTGCQDLEVRDVSLVRAPSWTLHLLGCRGVLIDGIGIRNQLDVPNCDGIDPDHCRDVEIRNCDIVCGDDAIVLKTTRPGAAYGPCAGIRVHDCRIETQDAGLKVGTETTQDIHDVRFDRCRIVSSGRGLGIQLRDEGSVFDIDFRDIELVSRYFAEPWWGFGEAVSLTAIARQPDARVGTIHDVRLANITARAENSIRLDGSPQSRLRDIRLENVALTLERWTKYPGGRFDNRPTTALPAIEAHGTPGICVRHADNVAIRNCRVVWDPNPPDDFTHALDAADVTGLDASGLTGKDAHPGRPP